MGKTERVATVGVSSVRTVSKQHDIDLSLTVPEPAVTVDHPVMVRITVQNRTDTAQSVLAGGGARPVFSTYVSEELHPGLVLATSSEARETQTEGEKHTCWRLARIPRNDLLGQNYIVLSPEESQSLEVEVWGHPENSSPDCFPSGVYHFKEHYEYQPIGGDPQQCEWEFGLRVSNQAPGK